MDNSMDTRGFRVERRTSRSLTLVHPVCCPAGCYFARDQIEEIAEKRALECADRSDADWLTRYIERLGGDPRPSTEPASLLLVAERMDCFVVTGADLWSMAEALGHLILHFSHVEPTDDGLPGVLAVPAALSPRGPFARARLEAVWFAAAFLMPSARFREVWARNDGNLRRVSAALGMPMAMVATRAVHLQVS